MKPFFDNLFNKYGLCDLYYIVLGHWALAFVDLGMFLI